MNQALAKLRKLQTEINSQNDKYCLEADNLMFCEVGDLIRVHYFGIPWEESFDKILNVVSEKDVAGKILSLSFDSPDEGANGTNNFDFSALVECATTFQELRSFAVRLAAPEDHNRTIVARTYEEEGMIAKLIKKMPELLSLRIPSAPNEEFFQLTSHPLKHLIIQVGFDSQDFILNLSDSTGFKNLRYLDFTDFQETYIEDWKDNCTPFEHFERFVNSKAFDSIKLMILRNLTYSDEQVKNLKSIRKDTVFRLIRTESNYIY